MPVSFGTTMNPDFRTLKRLVLIVAEADGVFYYYGDDVPPKEHLLKLMQNANIDAKIKII